MVSASLRVCRLPTKAGFFSRPAHTAGVCHGSPTFSSETNACDRSALASRRRRQTLPDVRCSSFHDAVVRQAIPCDPWHENLIPGRGTSDLNTDKGEVGGSSPPRPTNYRFSVISHELLAKKFALRGFDCVFFWGRSCKGFSAFRFRLPLPALDRVVAVPSLRERLKREKGQVHPNLSRLACTLDRNIRSDGRRGRRNASWDDRPARRSDLPGHECASYGAVRGQQTRKMGIHAIRWL